MEKKSIAILVVIALILIGVAIFGGIQLRAMIGGNKDWHDTVYRYDAAIISLPNGEVIEGEVENWRDYDDGEQLQIKINGVTYLVHSENVVLISNV